MEPRVRILIVDDQRSTRQGLKALLSLFPDVDIVGEAGDGKQALDMVAEHRPHVVLMDLKMPLMSGLEATKQIKKQWPEVKIIALTMYPGYRSEALAAGADAFLLKGSPTQALRNAIQDLALERRDP
jgi:DNA-binding NarL/FixJ family response regulator